MPADRNLNEYVEAYAGLEGRELIATAYRDFGKRAAVLSSFGTESAVLLHMVSEVASDFPVVTLDTEKLFPETIAYRDSLVQELGLTDLRVVHPDPRDLALTDPTGALHKIDADMCCHIRKTLPMQNAFKDFDVVISGRKRFHGASRTTLDFVTLQDGKLKLDPLAAFTGLDLHGYMQRYSLPSHPLKSAGYRSIGCMPCTKPGGSEEDPRAGRWAGMEKTECGIHFSANGKVIRTVVRDTALV